MRSTFFVVFAVVATALFVGVGAVGVGAVENASNETNETEEIADLLESETEVDTMEHQQRIRFNDHTSILGWEFSGGEVRVAIATERRATVTISDGMAGIGEDGATHVPESQYLIESGETMVLRMDAAEVQGGSAVGVTVRGTTIRLASEMDEAGSDPFQYFGGESGLFSGMLLALLSSVGGAGYVLWREDSGVMKA